MLVTALSSAEMTQQLHDNADQLREAGKTLEALDLYNRVIVNYQMAGNYQGILNALTGRVISWQHLYNPSKDRVFAVFAQKDVEAMVEIAKEHNITEKQHTIQFLLGKAKMLLKDYAGAEKAFKLATEMYPEKNAQSGDWIAHYGEAIYRNGKKEEGIHTILFGLDTIQKLSAGVEPFLLEVWTSGANLRLATLLYEDKRPKEAQVYLSLAKAIIDHNPKLVVRTRQLEALEKIIQP